MCVCVFINRGGGNLFCLNVISFSLSLLLSRLFNNMGDVRPFLVLLLNFASASLLLLSRFLWLFVVLQIAAFGLPQYKLYLYNNIMYISSVAIFNRILGLFFKKQKIISFTFYHDMDSSPLLMHKTVILSVNCQYFSKSPTISSFSGRRKPL